MKRKNVVNRLCSESSVVILSIGYLKNVSELLACQNENNG